MKRIISALLIISILFSFLVSCNQKQKPYEIKPTSPPISKSVYMVNIDTGKVIYESESQRSLRPGSLVQLMTAMVVIDSASDLDEEIKANDYTFGGIAGKKLPNIKIMSEETYTVRELLYAILLNGSYDAANLLAQHFGGENGEIKEFVNKMNNKAKSLGMEKTEYTNASGLHAEKQSTNAYDTYILAKEFYTNYISLFDLTNTSSFMTKERKNQNAHEIVNNNSLIDPNSTYYYENAKGIKYSSSSESGDSLVTFAEKNGLKYIVVLMNAPYSAEDRNYGYVYDPNQKEGSDSGTQNNSSGTGGTADVSSQKDVFNDAKLLYEWIFSNSENIKLTEEKTVLKIQMKDTSADGKTKFDKKEIQVGIDKDLKSLLPDDTEVNGLDIFCFREPYLDKEIKKGDIVGKGEVIGIYAKTSTETEKKTIEFNLIALESSNISVLSVLIKWIVIILMMLLLGLIVLVVVLRYYNLQRAKKRKAMRRKRQQQLARKSSGSTGSQPRPKPPANSTTQTTPTKQAKMPPKR